MTAPADALASPVSRSDSSSSLPPAPPRSAAVARGIAILASLIAGAVPAWITYRYLWHTEIQMLALAYTVVLVASGFLMFSRSVSALLLARSVWWSAFCFVVLLTMGGKPNEAASYELVMAFATGAALIASRWLEPADSQRGSFAPAAYRGAITTSMVMSLADAQALGWLGLSQLLADLQGYGEFISSSLAMLSAGVVALIALYGLYKLQLWGLVLSALTTSAIGVLAFTDVFGMRGQGVIPYVLAASAAAQLALLTPMFVAIVRRRPPAPASPRMARLAQLAPVALIATMLLLAVIGATLGRPHFKL